MSSSKVVCSSRFHKVFHHKTTKHRTMSMFYPPKITPKQPPQKHFKTFLSTGRFGNIAAPLLDRSKLITQQRFQQGGPQGQGTRQEQPLHLARVVEAVVLGPGLETKNIQTHSKRNTLISGKHNVRILFSDVS